MLEDIQVLCELQKIDDKIGIIKKRMSVLPGIVEDLEKKHNKDKESVKNVNQRLEQNILNQKNFELDISTNINEINKYENQLLSIKTNKEYKALNSEITHRKEKNAEIEEKLIELMEEESALKKEKRTLEKLYKQDRELLEIKKKEVNSEKNTLQKDVDSLEKEKKKIAKKISEVLFRRYQRLIEHKDGKAIATIIDGVCSGCHFRIRPQILIEVAKCKSIVICENCSRILISPKVC